MVSLFEPRLLVIRLDALSARFEVLESRLGKLEMLVDRRRGASLDFLPRLPRLHTLVLLKECRQARRNPRWKPEATLRDHHGKEWARIFRFFGT